MTVFKGSEEILEYKKAFNGLNKEMTIELKKRVMEDRSDLYTFEEVYICFLTDNWEELHDIKYIEEL